MTHTEKNNIFLNIYDTNVETIIIKNQLYMHLSYNEIIKFPNLKHLEITCLCFVNLKTLHYIFKNCKFVKIKVCVEILNHKKILYIKYGFDDNNFVFFESYYSLNFNQYSSLLYSLPYIINTLIFNSNIKLGNNKLPFNITKIITNYNFYFSHVTIPFNCIIETKCNKDFIKFIKKFKNDF